MKASIIVLFIAAIIVTSAAIAQTPKSSASAAPSASAQQSPQPPPTVTSAIDREVSIIEKEVVDAAEAMPEDKYNFTPESLNLPGSDYKGVRTFGEQVKHIAASNYLIWSPITGEKPPDTVNEGKGPETMKTKADIVKFLKESFAFGHKAVATLTTANLVEPIAFGKNTTTRLFLSTFAAAHCLDHYGQMAEYLRMNGIVPPASRKKSD